MLDGRTKILNAASELFLEGGMGALSVRAIAKRAGLSTTEPRRQEFSEEEIEAAVREAAADGKFVAAHAHAEVGAGLDGDRDVAAELRRCLLGQRLQNDEGQQRSCQRCGRISCREVHRN